MTIAPGVQTSLGNLDRGMQHRCAGTIDACVADPYNALAPVPGTDLRTAHIGDWRLIARVDKAEASVLVLTLRLFRSATRGLP